MNSSFEHDWQPEPQLLAAYFDGELEGRNDVADMRAHIGAWLEAHPEAAEEWAAHQNLKKLWLDTTPAEPSAKAWALVFERISVEPKRPSAVPVSRRRWMFAGAVAASVILFIGLLVGAWRSFGTTAKDGPINNGPEFADASNLEMLEVALSSEVTILRIDGADTEAVIVGEMPVSAMLDLADPGEVNISCKCPRVVVRQDPLNRPMVWARADID